MRHRMKRKAKIVATMGPASSSREVIREMIKAGLNVARLNFSHGTHDEHTRVYALIREEAQALERHVAVFQDLCGPKVRIGEVEGGQVVLADESTVRLKHLSQPGPGAPLGSTSELYVEAFDPVVVMQPGERAVLADGRIMLIAESVENDAVSCRVAAGGKLRSRSGISVPESNLNLPCLTDKDRRDIKWAMEQQVDFVALSFVASEQDLLDARAEMEKYGTPLPLIAKIERAQCLDNLSGIVDASDAVMVARGDLGIDLPLERVPNAQRLIISTANFAGVPVITATQMLMSMVSEVRPTRAEVSDVVTAVRDGTDAVMLSEETAIGQHPALAIETLATIVEEAERELNYEWIRPSLKRSDRAKVVDAVCYAATGAAEKIGTSAILACTESGSTARLMAKYRPKQPLFGVTSQLRSLTRMALYWGVEPVFISMEEESGMEDEVREAMLAIRDQYGIKPGSRVVVTAGLRTKKSGSTNVMEIREIPRTT